LHDLIENFFRRLSQAECRLLLLDYDGTLAPFRIERDQAFPYPGVENRLNRIISREKTRLFIISGRAIADLKPLLKLKKYPEIWGSHGREKLSADGKYSLLEMDEEQKNGLEIAANFILENNLNDYLERKPVSLAIHFRGLEKNKILELKDKITDNWNRLEREYNLTYSKFDGGLELKIPGFDKGSVVKNILAGFSHPCLTAYLGDDLTDEDAFKVLPETALSILVRPDFRETAATAWIKPPEELIEFLDRWIKIDDTE